MIVQRTTVKARRGQTENAVELVLSEMARSDAARSCRVYTPMFSGQRTETLILEWEYEDLAEREQAWADWTALPTTPAFIKQWRELTEGTLSTEIWEMRTP